MGFFEKFSLFFFVFFFFFKAVILCNRFFVYLFVFMNSQRVNRGGKGKSG